MGNVYLDRRCIDFKWLLDQEFQELKETVMVLEELSCQHRNHFTIEKSLQS